MLMIQPLHLHNVLMFLVAMLVSCLFWLVSPCTCSAMHNVHKSTEVCSEVIDHPYINDGYFKPF